MPPKRKSTDSTASGAKKSKGPATNPEVDVETERALDKRWAPVSVSRNTDSEFRLRTRDPVNAFTYICLGCAPWKTERNEDESEDEDEEDEESIEQKKKDDAVSDLLLRRERSVSSAGSIADSISGGRRCHYSQACFRASRREMDLHKRRCGEVDHAEAGYCRARPG